MLRIELHLLIKGLKRLLNLKLNSYATDIAVTTFWACQQTSLTGITRWLESTLRRKSQSIPRKISHKPLTQWKIEIQLHKLPPNLIFHMRHFEGMHWYLWYCEILRSILRSILQFDLCLKCVLIFRLSSKTSLPEHGGRFRTVLPINLEKQLVEYVEEMSRRFYGLGTKDIQKLCYELAVQNNCDVPETWHVNKSVETFERNKLEESLARKEDKT